MGWRTAATALAVGATSLVLVGCAGVSDQQAVGAVGDTPPQTYAYSGQTETYVVPDGVTSLQLTAAGGGGGTVHDFNSHRAAGALVSGSIAVQAGQHVLVSVGQAGGDAGTTDDDRRAAGAAWARTVATGTRQRTTSAQQGPEVEPPPSSSRTRAATTRRPSLSPEAGVATGEPVATWTLSAAAARLVARALTNPRLDVDRCNGSDGSPILGGKGGKAGGETGMAGARSKGGSRLGGNGGGGGGGMNGGSPGTSAGGTSAAGGGGAGTSVAQNVTSTAVTCYADGETGYGHGDGYVTISPDGGSLHGGNKVGQ